MSTLCERSLRRGRIPSLPTTPEQGETSTYTTASNMEVLASAMNQRPTSVVHLVLVFDKVEREVDKSKFSRIQTQTRQTMERLMSVLAACTTLRELMVWGPRYQLFTQRAWQFLVQTVHNNRSLQGLSASFCCLEDDKVIELTSELQHTTKLCLLYLDDNMLFDRGVRALAHVLAHNRTVRKLWLHGNKYGHDTSEWVKHQLAHLKPHGRRGALWV